MIKTRFVYLTSPPFSGSTLFSLLANAHPDIASVGEMTGPTSRQNPETYMCSCGCKIKDCGFWKQVAERMTSSELPFDPGSFDTRIRLGNTSLSQRILTGSLGNSILERIRDAMVKLSPMTNKRLRYLIHRNKSLATSILQVTGKSVFFDASKNPMRISHFINEKDIDLRLIHLVRDVRGTSQSKRKNQGKTDWRKNVHAWIRANRNIERQLKRLPPDRWLRIRYEDLCRKPAETLHQFFAFCGVEPQDLPLDFSSEEHHIVGNRMRLSSLGQIRLDEDWRRTVTPDEVALAWKLAGRTHVRYGYPPMTNADLAHTAG
jgi:hypothetical protein